MTKKYKNGTYSHRMSHVLAKNKIYRNKYESNDAQQNGLVAEHRADPRFRVTIGDSEFYK